MGLVQRQLKTNMYDSDRCVKFNNGSYAIAPPDFFAKYSTNSFRVKPDRMAKNAKVVLCMPEEGAPEGYRCKMIRPEDIHIYIQAYQDLLDGKEDED